MPANSFMKITNLLPVSICPFCFTEKKTETVCPCCGCGEDSLPQFVAQQVLPGSVLNNRFVVGKLLGQGSFGITYLCFDSERNQKVAIKEYFPSEYVRRQNLEMLPMADEYSDTVIRGMEYFCEEVKILMEFNQHSNIVQISDYFFENGTAYFVMEYVEGVSLKNYLDIQGDRISFEESWEILLPIMKTLAEVHQAGLLHRDIAPDNIFLCKNGEPKLLDFGSSRFAFSRDIMEFPLTIKPGYAPPEQYSDFDRQGPWTDIYQMGAVFYRTITGRIPPEATERLVSDPLISPIQLGLDIPEEADRSIMKALDLDPRDRFRNFSEMIKGFQC
ncbi:MAG TPA: serine/threonine-protein kinase [Flexilinea sp.]|nr:serine/threonine-protein kinase [Flexilinea sp.]